MSVRNLSVVVTHHKRCDNNRCRWRWWSCWDRLSYRLLVPIIVSLHGYAGEAREFSRIISATGSLAKNCFGKRWRVWLAPHINCSQQVSLYGYAGEAREFSRTTSTIGLLTHNNNLCETQWRNSCRTYQNNLSYIRLMAFLLLTRGCSHTTWIRSRMSRWGDTNN